jgi:hypothetical protein
MPVAIVAQRAGEIVGSSDLRTVQAPSSMSEEKAGKSPFTAIGRMRSHVAPSRPMSQTGPVSEAGAGSGSRVSG